MIRHQTGDNGSIVAGLILIALGALFLFGQFVRFDIWHYAWPLGVVGIGALFFVGMLAGGRAMGGLAIPGSIIVMLGLVFLLQNAFDLWASWAYAWALVAPTGVGIGMFIDGWWSDQPGLRQTGLRVAGVGLMLFVILGAFFELVLGLNRAFGLGRFLWPLLLIALGVVMLVGRSLGWMFRSAPTAPAAMPPRPAAPPPVGPVDRSGTQSGGAPSDLAPKT